MNRWTSAYINRWNGWVCIKLDKWKWDLEQWISVCISRISETVHQETRRRRSYPARKIITCLVLFTTSPTPPPPRLKNDDVGLLLVRDIRWTAAGGRRRGKGGREGVRRRRWSGWLGWEGKGGEGCSSPFCESLAGSYLCVSFTHTFPSP